MDAQVAEALKHNQIIDITTRGRKSGEARRIEIALWALADGYAISGRPGRPRSWYANLRANPDFTLHLKQTLTADLPAKALAVTDPSQRRTIIEEIAKGAGGGQIDVEAWVASSPLVLVAFE